MVKSLEVDSRIVGGKEVNPKYKLPYQVLVSVSQSDKREFHNLKSEIQTLKKKLCPQLLANFIHTFPAVQQARELLHVRGHHPQQGIFCISK